MSGTIDDGRVRAIARLARLALSDAEVSELARDLARIVDYVGVLGELDLAAVEPTAHPFRDAMPLREDAPAPTHAPERFLELAPDADPAGFRVPRVIGPEDA